MINFIEREGNLLKIKLPIKLPNYDNLEKGMFININANIIKSDIISIKFMGEKNNSLTNLYNLYDYLRHYIYDLEYYEKFIVNDKENYNRQLYNLNYLSKEIAMNLLDE